MEGVVLEPRVDRNLVDLEILTGTQDGLELPPQPPQKKPKVTKEISPVWSQFDKVVAKNDDGSILLNADGSTVMKASCKICNSLFVFGGTSGTSHLRRHTISCAKRVSGAGGQTILGKTPTGAIFSFTFSQNKARYETVRYFVREEIAFNKVEKPAFHRWVRNAFGPQFKPPCRRKMRDNVMKAFHEDKANLKDELKKVSGKICFTSDLWTSNQKLGYMCITAHYISNDWKLHKRIISFPVLPSPHSGKHINEALYANFLSWNLAEKIGTLTLDNASNNDNDVSRLKESIFGDDNICKELFHVRCNAHIINLLVQDGLNTAKSSLEKIRDCIKYIKSSQGKIQSFFDDCRSLNMKERRLPADMVIRWNSTYIMLSAAIPYQKVFSLFFCGSEVFSPSDEDWKNATVIRDFLKVFYDATNLFSGTKYVTSSAFCYQLSKMCLLLKKHANEPNFKVMCAEMKIKYDKYWQDVPVVLGLASCMDPRYKLTILEMILDLNYEPFPPPITVGLNPRTRSRVQSRVDSGPSGSEMKLSIYKNKLDELFDEYQRKMNYISHDSNEESSNVEDGDDMVLELLSKRREASVATCKSDLQRYLDQPILKVLNNAFNVLDWWKTQESSYPILAAMARDLLTIPVTTVASEAAFSSSRRVVSKYRSCLLPETVEALVCLKDWFQAEEGLQDEVLHDLEEIMEEGMEL